MLVRKTLEGHVLPGVRCFAGSQLVMKALGHGQNAPAGILVSHWMCTLPEKWMVLTAGPGNTEDGEQQNGLNTRPISGAFSRGVWTEERRTCAYGKAPTWMHFCQKHGRGRGASCRC